MGGISAFIALLSVGVLGRWRWTFWLILVAFPIGIVMLSEFRRAGPWGDSQAAPR